MTDIHLIFKDGRPGGLAVHNIAAADAVLEKGETMFEDLRTDPNGWPQKREAIFLFVRHYNSEHLRSFKRQDGSIMPYDKAAESMMKIVELHKQFPLKILENLLTGNSEITLRNQAKPETVFECSVLVLAAIRAAQNGNNDPTGRLHLLTDDCYRIFCPIIAYSEMGKIAANIGKVTRNFSEKGKTLLFQIKQSAMESIGKLRKNADELEQRVGKAAKRISELESELEEKIENIKPEIERQARFFSDEAAGHKRQAGYWLAATILSLVALGCTGYWTLLNPIDFGDNISLIAQAIFGRAIIFGALGSAIFMCARNYRSHRHNAVVNKHRENALKTYQAFLKEADEFKDPATKAIVLDYAAKCIYAPQETGYDKIGGGKDATLIDIRRILGKTDGE